MDLSPPEENSRTRDKLTFIAAVKKGVIPAAHVYALYREIHPSPVGRVRGPCADAGIFFMGGGGGGIQVRLT